MRSRVRWLLILCLVPLAASAVTLRYKFKPNSTLTYRETFTGEGTMRIAVAGAEQAIPLSLSSRDDRTMKFGRAEADGTVWVESRSDGANIALNVMGQPQQERGPATFFKLKMNPQGDILEVEDARANPQQGESMATLALGGMAQTLGLIGFPDGDIAVGGTWDKEVPVRSPDGRRLVARAANKLVAIKTDDDGIRAEIETRFEVPIPKSTGQFAVQGMQLPISVEGTHTGTSTTTWDVVRGCVIKTTSTGTMRLALGLAGGVGAGMDAAQVELKTTVGTELQD